MVYAESEMLDWISRPGGSSTWPSRLREKAAPPTKDYLLVFVGEGEDQARAAAAIASAKGFERTAVLEGGVEAFGSSVLAQVHTSITQGTQVLNVVITIVLLGLERFH